MGAGDIKLWLVLVWAMPLSLSDKILPCMLLTLFITGLGQILWRWLRKKPLTGISSPAAWRTIPFILALYVH
jgi:Flp pilus assembly protein protease CpaA